MTSQYVPDFSRLSVAVVGDLIADRYLACEPKGLSREAPVMVLRHVSERVGAGGAANVARNARALGAKVALLGCTGRDAPGREILTLLDNEGIDVTGVQTVPGWTTPTKTRVIAAEARRFPQQVLRLDQDPAGPADREARLRAIEALRAGVARFDLVLVSDYEYGMVSMELARCASEIAAAGKIVVLDPRRKLEGFRGLTSITPNLGELAALSRVAPEELTQVASLGRAAAGLASAARFVLVTRGNLGMALFATDGSANPACVPASGSGNVTDVSGAGDTAAAVFALAIAAGAQPERAMELANVASGVVVMESGAVPCSLAALRAAVSENAVTQARSSVQA